MGAQGGGYEKRVGYESQKRRMKNRIVERRVNGFEPHASRRRPFGEIRRVAKFERRKGIVRFGNAEAAYAKRIDHRFEGVGIGRARHGDLVYDRRRRDFGRLKRENDVRDETTALNRFYGTTRETAPVAQMRYAIEYRYAEVAGT